MSKTSILTIWAQTFILFLWISSSQPTAQESSQSNDLVLDAHRPQEIGILFGSSLNPWALNDWTEVSDTVRGGSSVAQLDLLQSDFPAAGLRLHGTLNTTTLGGAGFASQTYRRHLLSFPSEIFGGFVLEIGPLPSTTKLLRNFTLVLKNEVAPTDSNGRQQSTTSYEFDFSVPLLTHIHSSDKQITSLELDQRISILIPFSELRPTYRGRPKPDAKKFDPSNITELSLMCRSFFDKQSGSFDLKIFRLGLIYKTIHSISEKN